MAIYDAEVEWIEFKYGAYINTGIYPTSLDLDIWYLADDYVSFGWIYNNKASNTWIGAIKNTIRWKNYSSKKDLPVQTLYGVKRYKMNEGFFDGEILLQAFTASLGNSQIASIPLYIGGVYDGLNNAMSSNQSDYSGKPRRIVIYQGNTLVRDYIPVRVGQIGYLYDKVSDTLLGSDGTENFTFGPDRIKTSEFTKANFIDFRRRLLMGISISEIEYIESSGTQYIDTGITPSASTKIVFKFTNLQVTGDAIIGYQESTDKKDWRFFNYNQAAYFDTYGGTVANGTRISGGRISAGTSYTLEMGNYYIKDIQTGNNIINGPAYAGNGYDHIYINGKNTPSKNRWYFIQIYDNNVLVRDFIPVRLGQIGYLYDKVNKTLFGNSGSGNFILGNDVN